MTSRTHTSFRFRRRVPCIAAGLFCYLSAFDGYSQTLLTEDPPIQGSSFGFAAAATEKGIIYIGAPFSDAAAHEAGGALSSGAVVIFDSGGNRLGTISRGTQAGQWDAFGLAVATHGSNSITGANVLIGAPGAGMDRGRVYLYNGASAALLDTYQRPGSNRGQNTDFANILDSCHWARRTLRCHRAPDIFVRSVFCPFFCLVIFQPFHAWFPTRRYDKHCPFARRNFANPAALIRVRGRLSRYSRRLLTQVKPPPPTAGTLRWDRMLLIGSGSQS